MGRKSRHSAKTGDKALKKLEAQTTISSKSNSKSTSKYEYDDTMYGEVDQFHLDRNQAQDDFLQLHQSNPDPTNDSDSDDDNDDGMNGKEAVMDLGLAKHSDSESDDDIDSDSDSSHSDNEQEQLNHSEESSDSESSQNDSDPDDNILNWGKRKKDYYHGDTADFEIGQDYEDAITEEKAGQEIQQMRLQNMEETDFMPFKSSSPKSSFSTEDKEPPLKDPQDGEGDDDDDDNHTSDQLTRHRQSKIRRLNSRQKQTLLESNHPEFFPIVQYFSDRFLLPFKDKILLLSQQLLQDPQQAKAIGTNREGMEYLHQKQMLLMSTTLNLCTYLLMKCNAVQKEQSMNAVSSTNENNNNNSNNNNLFASTTEDPNHPSLFDLRNHPIIARLESFARMADQWEKKVETPLGLQKQLESLVQAVQLMNGEDVLQKSGSDSSDDSISDSDEETEESDVQDTVPSTSNVPTSLQSEESDSSDEDDDEIEQNLVHDARFGVRSQDIETLTPKSRRRTPAPFPSSDFGDQDDQDEDTRREASKKLASTMNTIAQKQKRSKSKNSSSSDMVDDIPDRHFVSGAGAGTAHDDMDEYERGLKMMEDDMGAASDDEQDDDIDNELDDYGMEDDFYALAKNKSREKKQKKKEKYAVASKYPTLDTEVDGERAIGRMIMKNRGLVAHKNKLNRNPRVKKREQYRKALIRRRGAVREIRTDEAHAYGGESTGIKTGLSRSRKLGVRK